MPDPKPRPAAPDPAPADTAPGAAAETGPRPRGGFRRLAPLVRLLGTVGLMALALRGVEWPQLWAVLRGADWRWWGAGLALMLAVQAVAAVRWAMLARPVGFDLPLVLFVRRFFEGLFFNLFLPTSIGGDVVKAYRLADTTGGRVLAACTVLADRLAGLTALGVIGTTALVAHQRSLAATSSLAVGVAIAGGVMLVARTVVANLERLVAILPRNRAVDLLAARLLPYQRRPSLITSAIGWGLVVQIGGVLSTACVARSLGVAIPLPTWFMVVPLVSLMTVLPISIGGMGVREGMMTVMLAPLGVRKETAVAIGLLAFLTSVACGFVGGLVFLAEGRAPDPSRDRR